MLPNIDLTKEMKISPSVKEIDGVNRSSLFINQDGKAMKHAYSREKPERYAGYGTSYGKGCAYLG